MSATAGNGVQSPSPTDWWDQSNSGIPPTTVIATTTTTVSFLTTTTDSQQTPVTTFTTTTDGSALTTTSAITSNLTPFPFTTTTDSTFVTTSPSPSTDSNALADSGDSAPKKLSGGMIGLIVILLLVMGIALGACLWFCRKRRKREEKEEEFIIEGDGIGYSEMIKKEAESKPWAWDVEKESAGDGLAKNVGTHSQTRESDSGTEFSSSQNGRSDDGLLGMDALSAAEIFIRDELYNTPLRRSVVNLNEDVADASLAPTDTPPMIVGGTGTPPRPPRRAPVSNPKSSNETTRTGTYGSILDSYTTEPTLNTPPNDQPDNASHLSLSPPSTQQPQAPKRLSPPFRNTTPTWAGLPSPTSTTKTPLPTPPGPTSTPDPTKTPPPKSKRDSTLSWAPSISSTDETPFNPIQKRLSVRSSRLSWASSNYSDSSIVSSTSLPTISEHSSHPSSSLPNSPVAEQKHTYRLSILGEPQPGWKPEASPVGSVGGNSSAGSLLNASLTYAYDSPGEDGVGENGYVANSRSGWE
ncbi:hypothetical protein HDV00_000224 [Rhizophlyctis rosea]|nr:hypothetical protein HDV00_000224 [Rhizophlyctis rosea]